MEDNNLNCSEKNNNIFESLKVCDNYIVNKFPDIEDDQLGSFTNDLIQRMLQLETQFGIFFIFFGSVQQFFFYFCRSEQHLLL